MGGVDFVCDLDSSSYVHLNTAITVYKGTFKSIHCKLLEGVLEICKNKINEEVKTVEYLTVVFDENKT